MLTFILITTTTTDMFCKRDSSPVRYVDPKTWQKRKSYVCLTAFCAGVIEWIHMKCTPNVCLTVSSLCEGFQWKFLHKFVQAVLPMSGVPKRIRPTSQRCVALLHLDQLLSSKFLFISNLDLLFTLTLEEYQNLSVTLSVTCHFSKVTIETTLLRPPDNFMCFF